MATANAKPSFIPDGFRTVTPYLSVSGAADLLDFLVRGLDARVLGEHRAPDGVIANAALRIGDSTIEISEAHGEWGPTPAALHVYVPDVDAAHARALAAGATELHPPLDQPYGERSSALRDCGGNRWYLATRTPQP